MRALLAILLLFTTLLATSSAPAQSFGAMIHAVDENGQYRFEPPEAIVPPGSTIIVMAVGQEPHALKAVDGSFDTGPLDPTSEDGFQAQFQAPTPLGEYAFFCPYHSSPTGTAMNGKLIVREAAAASPTPSPTPTAATKDTPAGAVVGALVALGAAATVLSRRA